MFNQESTLNDLNLRTINAVVGYQGKGKTLFLTAVAYLYATAKNKVARHNTAVEFMRENNYKLDNENIIISNYNLELQKRGRDLQKYDAEKDIKDIFTFKKHLSSTSLVLVDEGQDEFNAREWYNTDRKASRFCEFARHFDLNIIFSCQDFESIDKTFRGYSKIYFIDKSDVINVYGKTARTNEFFKNVDIDHIDIYYYEFDTYEKYRKFKENQSFFDVFIRKKITINANLFNMYNHNYLNKTFLEKKRSKKNER